MSPSLMTLIKPQMHQVFQAYLVRMFVTICSIEWAFTNMILTQNKCRPITECCELEEKIDDLMGKRRSGLLCLVSDTFDIYMCK